MESRRCSSSSRNSRANCNDPVVLRSEMALARMECSVVVVGDAKIGKTALIRRLTKNEFTEVGTPYFLVL